MAHLQYIASGNEKWPDDATCEHCGTPLADPEPGLWFRTAVPIKTFACPSCRGRVRVVAVEKVHDPDAWSR